MTKLHLHIGLYILLAFVICACNSPGPSHTATSTHKSSSTLPVSTSTPTPSLSQLRNTPPPVTAAPATITQKTPTYLPPITTTPIRASKPTNTPTATLRPTLGAKAFQRIGTLGKGAIYTTLWSPDGKVFAIVSSAGTSLYNTHTWQELLYLEKVYVDDGSCIAFSPDGKILVASTWDSLSLWDAETGYLIAATDGDAGCDITFAPNGDSFATIR